MLHWKWCNIRATQCVSPLLPWWSVLMSSQILMIDVHYHAVGHRGIRKLFGLGVAFYRLASCEMLLLSRLHKPADLISVRFNSWPTAATLVHISTKYRAPFYAKMLVLSIINGKPTCFSLTFPWPALLMSPQQSYLQSSKTRYCLCPSVGKANTHAPESFDVKTRRSNEKDDCHRTSSPVRSAASAREPPCSPPYATRHTRQECGAHMWTQADVLILCAVWWLKCPASFLLQILV